MGGEKWMVDGEGGGGAEQKNAVILSGAEALRSAVEGPLAPGGGGGGGLVVGDHGFHG